ncbi:hypothetical protein [Pseudarthrobacter cellobiosi]|uniref:hypothetical protein n=1 Tax=Pseudarthrobacter cellobiosi TaxID=2953654 RepID=UPI00208E32BE|nr:MULTISPECIES: hypothetical protein [unclassified Pseudarthrobacter]MCO4254976.1 hypothetical protein [Pseudarthrobacter sp. HLT1-5]MCO4273228.1 hypothetical protein [Pseudarthrobacter sp. HLT3-5]
MSVLIWGGLSQCVIQETGWSGAALRVVTDATEFLIENNRLIQRVHFNATSAFPVIADPFWLPVLLILAHVTRHAAMQAAKRGVRQALI